MSTTAPPSSDRLKSAGEIALSGLQTTLQIVKDVSNVAGGVPGLAAGIAGLAAILDAVQQTSDNAEGAEKLVEHVIELDKMLRSVFTTERLPEPILKRVLELLKKWETEGDKIKKLRSNSRIRRFIGSKTDAIEAIAGHLGAIDQSIRDFMLESILRTEVDVRGLRDDRQAQDMKVLLGFDVNIPHAKAAHFDYAYNNISRTGCMDGTRTEILQKLYRWIDNRDVSSDSARIFWINGMAGTGKTTIAYTVSKYCRDSGIPLATFFCSRDSAETSNPNLVFPTIARQLGIMNENFAQELSKNFKSHPDTIYSAVSHQLEMLLVKPLNAAKEQFPRCVVVVDALDECKDDSSTSIILASLSHHLTNLPAIQFLITSRPEPSITQGFRPRVLQAATQSFNLHEEALGTVEKDIELYLTDHLRGTREDYELEDSWPSTSDTKSLTHLSEGLFIYAATAIKFIGDTAYDHPKQQLDRLLHGQGGKIGSLTQRLDELYMQILEVALSNMAVERHDLVNRVLGSIVLLRDPLSALDLENLLNLEPGEVKRAVRRLHSALHIPEDEQRIIRVIHPSFYDFIIDASRCTIPRFAIIPRDRHEMLARACFEALLKGLRRDICGIKDPSKLNSEVVDLQDRVTSYLLPHLQYACRNWMWHLGRSQASSELLGMMQEFVQKKLLYWIEACSLLGELRTAIVGLDEVQRWLIISGNDVGDINKLVYDGVRFIRDFFSVLSTASLHTYHSALVWTPLNSLLRATYEHELTNVVKPLNCIFNQWSPCLHPLEGHTDNIHSVAFSPDGTKIISGSSDHTIRLWDAVTGVLLRVFSGHTGRIYSVAASPSGSMIVSGSDDNTIRIWDMATGALLRIFKDDFGKVLSIMCPAENAWVAVGTKYNDIVLSRWDSDMSDGVFLRTLHGHTIDVWCLSISANGELAVSGSLDRTVRVWHVESGALRATFEGHEDTISAVAFSPDGRRIISGSYDYTMRIWDMETSSLLLMRKLDYPVWSVIHLPLTNEAASGCNDTIYIWNATTSDPLRTLQSHDAACLSLAISQDGMCIASAGYTDKILIWQVEGNSSEPERFWRIDLVKFSPNGSRIVSATDSTLRIWDVSTGTLLRTLEDHPDNISTTSFSEDSAQLLTASGDTIIRLWDMDTGTLLKTFEGHGRDIASVGFIHGGTQIFSITWDRQIRVQDTATGIVIQTMQWEFLHNPHCTALFPNGGQIAVAMEDVIQVWDLAGGGLQKTLQGHSSMVTGITFSADGTQIVSCSSDGSVRLWHAVTGTEIKAFHIDGKIPDNWKVWFSSDQKSIFTNSELVTIPKEFLSIGSLENAGALTSIYDPGYFMSSGWLWTQQPRRRICWVPSGWRHRKDQISISDMFTWHGTNVAFGTLNGVVFIDTTDAVDYLKNFY